MKRFHKLIGIVLSLTIIMLISGCSGGSDTTTATNTSTTPTATNTNTTPAAINTAETTTNTSGDTSNTNDTSTETTTSSSDTSTDSNIGTVVLSLTDAPADDENITGVYVTFDALRYQYADSEDNWEDVELNVSRTINLLDLQDGNTTLLNQVDLPAGKISHVRFVLDTENCRIELDEDVNETLEVPSGDQTGFKAIGGFTIPEGGIVNVTADFDVRKSVTSTGHGSYLLKPTIKIIDNVEVGEINGTVTLTLDDNVSSLIIYAYEDGSWDNNESNASNDFGGAALSTDGIDGRYTLPWLTIDDYDLVVVTRDNNGSFMETLGFYDNIPVAAGETTTQDIAEPLPALP